MNWWEKGYHCQWCYEARSMRQKIRDIADDVAAFCEEVPEAIISRLVG